MPGSDNSSRSQRREFLATFALKFASIVALIIGAAIVGALVGVFFGWPLIVYFAFPGTLFAPPTMPPNMTFLYALAGWIVVAAIVTVAWGKAQEEVYD